VRRAAHIRSDPAGLAGAARRGAVSGESGSQGPAIRPRAQPEALAEQIDALEREEPQPNKGG
jgi:hypothetical protein